MSGVKLSDPVAKDEGVEFTATRGAVVQRFLAHRAGLQSLDYSVLETSEALLKAFLRHQGQVANIAGRSLDDGCHEGRTIVLRSLL